jgi:hypothetical protein
MDGDHHSATTTAGKSPHMTEQTGAMQVVRLDGSSDLVAKVDTALTAAVLHGEFDTTQGIYSIAGMSGKRYRRFINQLVGSVNDARYLEVGSWAGSTLCSAIHGNKVWAVAIDNWSQFGGPKDAFIANVHRFKTAGSEVIFIESDFRKVDYRQMQRGFNIYLFDGPHTRQDQYDGLAMALPALDDRFVFIVDDWNWKPVRTGTKEAIEKCRLKVLYAAEVRTTLDETHTPVAGGKSDWHNGYFISVLEKPPSVVV